MLYIYMCNKHNKLSLLNEQTKKNGNICLFSMAIFFLIQSDYDNKKSG